jgi:hypothetical protein
MANKVNASFMIDPDLLKQMDAVARAQGISRSNLLGRWIRDHVASEQHYLGLFNSPAMVHAFAQVLANPAFLRHVASAVKQDGDENTAVMLQQALNALEWQAKGVREGHIDPYGSPNKQKADDASPPPPRQKKAVKKKGRKQPSV